MIARNFFLTLSQVGLVSLSVFLNPFNSDAAIINYNFSVNLDSGNLAGQSYFGSLSYNDALLTGSGDESASLNTFTFNFQGIDYNQSQDPGASVLFFDGSFLGTDYTFTGAISPFSFNFVPGFFDASDAAFFYTPSSGNSGSGGVIYNKVPEPSAIMSLLGLTIYGGICLLFKRGNRHDFPNS